MCLDEMMVSGVPSLHDGGRLSVTGGLPPTSSTLSHHPHGVGHHLHGTPGAHLPTTTPTGHYALPPVSSVRGGGGGGGGGGSGGGAGSVLSAAPTTSPSTTCLTSPGALSSHSRSSHSQSGSSSSSSVSHSQQSQLTSVKTGTFCLYYSLPMYSDVRCHTQRFSHSTASTTAPYS